MRGEGERGQITIFILLGIVLLILTIFLFVLHNALTHKIKPIDNAPERIVKENVRSCLDLSVDEGLQLLGRQGGRIYKYQGGVGSFDGSRAVQVTLLKHLGDGAGGESVGELKNSNGDTIESNVSFGLVRRAPTPAPPSSCPRGFFPQHEEQEDCYPWPYILLVQLTRPSIFDTGLKQWINLSDNHLDGAFGHFVLRKLCNDTAQSEQAARGSLLCGDLSARAGWEKPSIQDSLKSFILNRTLNCIVKTGNLSEELDTGILFGEANLSLVFTQSSLLLDLTLPTTLSRKNSEAKMTKFSKRYPVNLYSVYDFIFHLLKRASKDPYFNIERDYAQIPTFKNGFSLHEWRLKNDQIADSTFYNDLFLVDVADENSLVMDQPFHFYFLIQDRKPILDNITYESFNVDEKMKKKTGGGIYFKGVTVRVLDPDSDTLTVDVKGIGLVGGGGEEGQLNNYGITFISSTSEVISKYIQFIKDYHPCPHSPLTISVKDKSGQTDWQFYPPKNFSS